MAGWGSGSWGISPWGTGAGSVPALSVSYAFASAKNRAIVAVTLTPRNTNAANPGDALNPATWEIKRLDTGAVFTILSVSGLTATTYELTLLEELGDSTVTHQARAVSLVDSLGNAAVPPLTAQFKGLHTSLGGDTPDARRDDLIDLRYYQVSRNPIGGTLNIGSDGDYQVMGGKELVRKLVIRRLLTRPGEFFHLPNYGFDFGIKDVVPSTELLRVRKSILEGVLEEPEVSDAGVALKLDGANGILTVQIRAVLQPAGETLEINTELPIGAVGF